LDNYFLLIFLGVKGLILYALVNMTHEEEFSLYLFPSRFQEI
jgi:hypothetical protein